MCFIRSAIFSPTTKVQHLKFLSVVSSSSTLSDPKLDVSDIKSHKKSGKRGFLGYTVTICGGSSPTHMARSSFGARAPPLAARPLGADHRLVQ